MAAAEPETPCQMKTLNPVQRAMLPARRTAEQHQVVFRCFAPEANVVQVAGSFNGWWPEANPLVHLGSGQWTAWLMIRSGQYKYRFVVDGIWAEDRHLSKAVTDCSGEAISMLTVADGRTDLR
jgi:1,4-alpha-glucan branching enzyme